MSKKKFISFLGTSNYHYCNYSSAGKEAVKNVKYVQEATIKQHCMDYDNFIFFLTQDALKKNWLDNGHFDTEGKQIVNSGLQSCLNKMGLDEKLEPVVIKEGFNNEEIWGIFQSIYQKISDNDQIVFDITHAFRFLPMLGMVLINYLKTLKNVEVKGIYYGAFEALGPAHIVKKMNADERNVEILDLLNFSLLQDWTIAAHAMLKFGNTEKLSELAKMEINPLLKASEGNDTDAANLRSFINPLNSIFQNIAACRGKAVYVNKDYENVNKSLGQLKKDLIPPMKPLIEKLEDRVQLLNSNKHIMNGFKAVEWCIEYDWIQQGFTILFETGISYILWKNDLDIDNLNHRNITSSCFTIHQKSIPENEWGKNTSENIEVTKKVLTSRIFIAICPEMASLQHTRNDINHAGFRNNPMPYKKLKAFLINTYNAIVLKMA